MGEPGTQQAMFLRGTSVPLFSKVDAMSTQPAVYVNGVPIIENRAYSYSIKNNDVNPLGTATQSSGRFTFGQYRVDRSYKRPLRAG